MVRFGLWNVLIVSTALVVPLTAPSSSHSWIYPVPQTQPDCPPAQPWSEGRELTFAEKTDAFSDVLTNGQSYGDYNFALNTSTTPSGVLLPVLAKSVAGVESDWTQYTNTGVTKINADCDSGMMQVNGVLYANLFNLSPSLRSDTKGNIAAGSQVLKEKWDRGSVGPEPVVNDQDPEQLLSWYYAISSYNGGPTPGSWANNPNCGPLLSCGPGVNYSTSRFADWQELNAGLFPYQERVLYNLQYPKLPNGNLWDVAGLGLQEETFPSDYGIRPDDSLFLSSSGTSRTPNLLLFKHSGSQVYTGLTQQVFFLDYELPLAATVTIELLNNAVNGTVLATLLPAAPRTAGWQNERFTITQPVQSGYAYRIRATRGDPAVLATYYEGQYVQNLDVATLGSGGSGSQTFLPFIGTGTPTVPDPVRDGSLLVSTTTDLPMNWNLQSIYGPGINAATQAKLEPVPGKVANQLRIAAAPGGRVELTQRVHVPNPVTDNPVEPIKYCLRYGLEIEGAAGDPGTTFTARTRSLNGTTWSPSSRSDAPEPARDREKLLSVPTKADRDQIISFLAIFGPADTDTVFKLTQIRLTEGPCTTIGPNVAP